MENENIFNQQFPDTEEIDLSDFDDQFSDTEVQKDDYEPVPDGRYQVNVDKAEIKRAKSSGNPMLAWTLRILGPRFRNRLLWKNSVIASPENLKWLKTDLYTCGLELKKISDLPNRLDSLLDVALEVAVRTRGENQNVYFNKRLVLDEGAGGQDAGVSPELLPF